MAVKQPPTIAPILDCVPPSPEIPKINKCSADITDKEDRNLNINNELRDFNIVQSLLTYLPLGVTVVGLFRL